MNKVSIIKAIVKLYFLGAVAGSYSHLQHASVKLGGSGWETFAAPAMIDGMFVIAMILRSEDFAPRTQRIGFRLMLTMGAVSLSGNVFAGSSAFGYLFGAMLPAFLLLGEWLSDRKQIVSAKAQADADAIAAAEAAVAQAAADAQAKKAAASAKGKATKARNARTRKAQTKALEGMLK